MKEQVYLLEQFDDIKILRYDVPAFEGLTLREKLFVYYLGRAALAGRDILWDQNNKYNLRVRAAWRRFCGITGETGMRKGFNISWSTRRRCFLLTGYIIIIPWRSSCPVSLPGISNRCFGKWGRNRCTRSWNG